MAEQRTLSGLLERLENHLALPYEEDQGVKEAEIEMMRRELDYLNRSIKDTNEEQYSVKVYAEQMREASVLIEDLLEVYDHQRRTGAQIAELMSHKNLDQKIKNIDALLIYKKKPGKFTSVTTSRRLNITIRAMVGLVSMKPKLQRVTSTSSSFASDGLSFFSDDIED